MGWRRDFKKQMKDEKRRKNIFDYSDGESSYIEWIRSNGSTDTWNIEQVQSEIEKYDEWTREIYKFNNMPETLKKGYSYHFPISMFEEQFYGYPAASKFHKSMVYLNTKLGTYGAFVCGLSLAKFTYFTSNKFWKVFNLTFAGYPIDNQHLLRVFEVMQRTTLDQLDAMIERTVIMLDGISLDPYKHFLTVEDIIDSGEDFTYHWSRMLDQVVDLTIESLNFEKVYGQYNQTEEFEDFDDFFEKTKTMVLNDEANDAFNYFGLTKNTTPREFKKIYRTLAKQFHPDINKEPSAAVEMKKINMFKGIIENYFEKYNILD